MSEFDARRTRTCDGGNTASGADDAGAGHYRLGNPGFPVPTGDAWRDLEAARGQLGDVRRDNEILKRKNEQLMQKLVSVSRRAVAANRMAHHDVLTGLPNRLLLIKRLQRAIADAFQRQMLLALLFIDLDGFKAINDRFGHKIGDRLLSVVAARIAACVRADDIACRYGGDEFVALLANIDDPAIAISISQKIRDQIGRNYWIEGHLIQVTASIGLAIYPADGERYDALLSHADAAMYRSKAARRKLRALSGATVTAAMDTGIR
jgi:diguanylate cyclase (GGDEF)-like protein